MLNLIMKDFKISKTWIFLLVLSIIFAFAISMTTSSDMIETKWIHNIAFSYAIFMIVYIGVIDSSYQSMVNKSEVVLNSFPINRKDIVRGKYAIMIVYIIMYSIPMVITSKIIIPLFFHAESYLQILWVLLIITTINLIFYSIYYPLYFKSEDGLMTFSQAFRLIIILLPSVLTKYIKKIPVNRVSYFIEKVGNRRTWVLFLILGFVFYYISLQVSKKIYIRKEF